MILKKEIREILNTTEYSKSRITSKYFSEDGGVIVTVTPKSSSIAFNKVFDAINATNLFNVVGDAMNGNIFVTYKYNGVLPSTYIETAKEFIHTYNIYAKDMSQFDKLKALFHHYCELRGITHIIEYPLFGGGKIKYTYNIKESSWGECGVVNWFKVINKTKDLENVESEYVFS